MNVGSIAGGTNAGWRRTGASKPAWTCLCGRENQSYNANCPSCYAKR